MESLAQLFVTGRVEAVRDEYTSVGPHKKQRGTIQKQHFHISTLLR